MIRLVPADFHYNRSSPLHTTVPRSCLLKMENRKQQRHQTNRIYETGDLGGAFAEESMELKEWSRGVRMCVCI